MPLDYPRSSPHHAKHLELCSLFCTGALEQEEAIEFETHFENCAECQLLVAEYKELITQAMPLVADEAELQEASGFDRELRNTKKNLFAALEQGTGEPERPGHGLQRRPSAASFNSFPVALAIGLSIVLGISGYWLGVSNRSRSRAPVPTTNGTQLELNIQLQRAARARDLLDAKLKEDDQRMAGLNATISRGQSEIENLKKRIDESEQGTTQQRLALGHLSEENSALRSDRDSATGQLQTAEKSIADMKQQVDRLESERVVNLLESASLQKTVTDLQAKLASTDAMPLDAQKLLTSDRDIRELIGARDLLIADVADVDHDGKTRKPFGRIFYTKKKSLIFYAFDLDKSPGFRNTRTFQAWGTKSSDDKSQPVSMGMFYLDNEANRRWILRFEDPKVLEQIDSVFVTLEPRGGSERPSQNQLLYAYLLTKPNHP